MMQAAWHVLFVLVAAGASASPTGGAADSPAPPTGSEVTEDANWSSATSNWGARGLYRVDAAHGVKPGSLIFTLNSELSYATSLFTAGDSDLLSANRLWVLWSPVAGLDLGLSEVLKINTWDTWVPAKLQVLGLQRLYVKYSREWFPGIGLGARLQWQLPTAVYSAGAVPKASVLHLDALATWQLPHRIELSANLGYIYDHSRTLAGRDTTPDKRWVYEVNDGGALSFGVGAGMDLRIKRRLVIAPFLEVSGRINVFKQTQNNPVVTSLGAKIFGTEAHTIEFALGLDVRVIGAPQAGSGFAGVPPWTGFAVLSLHIFDHPPPTTLLALPCDSNEDCPSGELCVDALCRYTTEVVKETIKRVKQDTFTVAGSVVDAETGRPIEEAAVVFRGFEHTPVQVDIKTGRFASFPLDTGEGLLELMVTAPDYKPLTTAVARGKPNDVVYTNVKLRRTDRPDFGTVQGVVLDGRTGRPVVAAKISIPALQQTIEVGKNGRFKERVKLGRYDILVSARGWVTQRKHIVVHDGDTLILNVDLEREAHRRMNP